MHPWIDCEIDDYFANEVEICEHMMSRAKPKPKPKPKPSTGGHKPY